MISLEDRTGIPIVEEKKFFICHFQSDGSQQTDDGKQTKTFFSVVRHRSSVLFQ